MTITYYDIKRTVDATIQEIATYSPGKVAKFLEDAIATETDKAIWCNAQRLHIDISYDRGFCHRLGVENYARPTPDDNQRIKVAALALARLDPNLILPA